MHHRRPGLLGRLLTASRGPASRRPRPRLSLVERLESRTLLTLDFGFAQGLGGPGTFRIDGTAVDGAGYVYTAGRFTGTVDFDPLRSLPGNADIRTSAAGSTGGTSSIDAFVAKYAPDGALVWVRSVGSAFDDVARDVAIDSAGNVYATGLYTGTVNFGGGQSLTTSRADIFVWKLDASGQTLWARGPSSTAQNNVGFNQGLGIAVGTVQGQVKIALTGLVDAPTTFTTAGGTVTVTPTGVREAVVARLDGTSGNTEWARVLPMAQSNQIGQGNRVVIDGNGAIIATGGFLGTIDLNPGTGARNFTSAGGSDSFVVKLDAAGNYVFGEAFGGAGNDLGTGIAVDGESVYAIGYYFGSVDFDRDVSRPNGSDVAAAPSGATGLYVLRLEANGTFGWVRDLGVSLPSSDNAIGQPGIAVTSSTGLLVAGAFEGTANIGGTVLTSAGSSDVFLAQLDKTAGAVLQAGRSGGAGLDVVYDVATVVGGPAAVVGAYAPPATFGSTSPLPSRGTFNGFVSRVISAGKRTASGGATIVDFDGNGVTDVGYFAPASATWLTELKNPAGAAIGSRAASWGATAAVGAPLLEFPVPGDYDGNGVTDRAVWNIRNAVYKIEYLNAAGNVIGTNTFQFGFPGWYAEAIGVEQMQDLPIPGDYDGNGVTDLAVFRVETAEWIIKLLDKPAVPGRPNGIVNKSVAEGGNVVGNRWVQHGFPGWYARALGLEPLQDVPVPGDFDGNGVTDFAVYRRFSGEGDQGRWFVRFNDAAGNRIGTRIIPSVWELSDNTQVRSQGGGLNVNFPIPGDYDGNGVTDIAVWNLATSDWRIILMDASGFVINRPDDGVSNTRRQVFGSPGNAATNLFPTIPLQAPFSSLIKLGILPGPFTSGGSGTSSFASFGGGSSFDGDGGTRSLDIGGASILGTTAVPLPPTTGSGSALSTTGSSDPLSHSRRRTRLQFS